MPHAAYDAQTPYTEDTRYQFALPVTLVVQDGIGSACLVNLSIGGCRVRSRLDAPIGCRIEVIAKGWQTLRGRVIWRKDGLIGLRFFDALRPQAFRLMLRDSQGFDRIDGAVCI